MERPTVQVTTPSDREIAILRIFNAPRPLVFDAWTKPELLKRWYGPHGWSLSVCEIDLRVGGAYRFVMRHTDGAEMGFSGVYREVMSPERVVSTEKPDQAWFEGDAIDTLTFVQQDSKTAVTVTVLYDTKEIRDMVLESGMAQGYGASFERLDEYLASVA